MANQAKEIPGRFKKGQSGNPAGRQRGIQNGRTILLNALRERYGGSARQAEKAFWLHLLELGEASGLALVAKRLMPELKAESRALDIELSTEPLEAAETLLQLAGRGEISVEAARTLLSGIGDLLKAKEITELDARLVRLENQST